VPERAKKALRRSITIPGFIGVFGLGLVLLPVLLPLAVIIDSIRGSRFGVTRSIVFVVYYFGCESAGIVASFWLWAWGGMARWGPERWLDEHFRLQRWWALSLFRGARRLFDLRFEVVGGDVVPAGDGPFLLFLRHVSTADTILAAAFLTAPHGHRLRYVLKSELLWDPCLDIVGHRLPNCFVERSTERSEQDIRRVRDLARDLGPRDGILIYPEGTRFTPERRAKILRRLEASGDADRLERARALRHVLPPRLGGTFALLDDCPDVDAVFCAHAGFEGTMRLNDLVSGDLVGATVRIHFWRVPGSSIPRTEGERADWMFDQWSRIDRWITQQKTEAHTA